jgi:hypothetical protein
MYKREKMIRNIHKDAIDRLTAVSESSHHKKAWVQFAFQRCRNKAERLTLDEWLYLADKSGYTKLWAHEEYNRQESAAWHQRRLDPIETELKRQNETEHT